MNTAITKRSLAKGGRDATAFSAPALLIVQVLSGWIDLSPEQFGLLVALLAPVLSIAYRVLRDHGLLMPADDPAPMDPRLEAGLDEMFKRRVRAALAEPSVEPTIGGNV